MLALSHVKKQPDTYNLGGHHSKARKQGRDIAVGLYLQQQVGHIGLKMKGTL